MAGSYEKINYSLRPAKQIQRRMLCETFRRLSVFGAVASYRYIGFGSPYFADFALIHKSLGITDMVCVEVNEHHKERFEFNKPFVCIRLKYGHSNDVLPALAWTDTRCIVWLDYDGTLDNNVLTDIAIVCANVTPASLFVLTVEADSRPDEMQRLAKLKKAVGEDRVPADVQENDLAGWDMSKVLRRIIVNEVLSALNARNGGRREANRIEFKPLFNFQYADSAKMLTVGGLLYDTGQAPLVARCSFEQLSFVRVGEEAYRIKVPMLTYRELRHLDQHLPTANLGELTMHSVPQEDLQTYAAVYRYFPTFAETEI